VKTAQPSGQPARGPKQDPIDRVVWMPADDLSANNYNPNIVFTPELRLLETSLLRSGWIQPILATREDVIVDGFHRWMLSRTSARLREVYRGMVPVAVLDLTRAEAIMLTVRINRAKGSHTALKMADLVKELVNQHGLDFQEIATGIGAAADEIELLMQESVFTDRNLKDYRYSKAWYPIEDGKPGKQQPEGSAGP